MNLRTQYLFVACTLLAAHTCIGGVPGAEADSARQFGLLFDVEAAPNLSSLQSYQSGGYTVSLGFGVRISRRFLATVNVYSGSQSMGEALTRPVSGRLSVGGGALELTYVLSRGATVCPYAACGFGLFTYLGGQYGFRGYSGNGPHFEIGGQWDFSQYFSLRAGIRYTRLYFYNPVSDGSDTGVFKPFTENLLGGAIRFSFYPSVLP